MAKNCLRRCPIAWIGGASVRKINLLLTVISGCALAVSANAARTEVLSFQPQSVFQKRTEKAASEPAKSEKRTEKAASEPVKSQFVFKDKAGKTVSAPIVERY